MQASPTVAHDLLAALESIDGVEASAGEALSRHNTFRIGGPAELLLRVSTVDGLRKARAVIAEAADAVATQVLGLGSNVLIPDHGLSGVVLKFEGDFDRVEFREELVWAGAAVSLGQLARSTAAQGLTGLEALSGFPSTVGGAVVMNAGCYGTEIKDLLVETTVVGASGELSTWTIEDLQPGYRSTRLQGRDEIVADALFRTRRGDSETALGRIRELNSKRKSTLPSGYPNVGSIFRNPEGDYAGRLIDECGLKGLEVGGARISEKHGNVIVNFDGASAADVLELMMRARAEVEGRFGVRLEPEVVLTGDLRARWRAGSR